ncbi:PREDICTED: uncharacterized protein LOC104790515 [Camelina sativa]|uniref:Uncharacterized protein LOC104790515 n=1 Tax=Camelina sativa TaxID=90675 RepID=A0ABM0ZEE2_CAMSA|nr:PREDICTED: uncharacterized protein LOC104790515 [Camelina sativa]
MARISLLFSLALVLAIGSVFANPQTHKKTKQILCPSTLSELQSFSYNEISKFVEEQAQSAPDKVQFKVLFDACKGYTEFLGSFNYTGAKEEVFEKSHAIFNVLTRALGAAQAQVGVVELGAKLSRNYAVMAQSYIRLVWRIAAISGEYKFNANAKISQSERAEIDSHMIRLKSAIKVYVKVITQCTKKFPVGNNIDLPSMPGLFTGMSRKKSGSYIDISIAAGAQGRAGTGFEFGADRHAKGKSFLTAKGN